LLKESRFCLQKPSGKRPAQVTLVICRWLFHRLDQRDLLMQSAIGQLHDDNGYQHKHNSDRLQGPHHLT